MLGAGVIGHKDLDEREADFARLGQALTVGGDLLLYGCNVAQGDQGRAFISRIAELTGADVAASESLTGAEALGGNWRLEFQQGSVQARSLEISAYRGVFTVPVITDPSALTFSEGGAVQFIQGVTLANGLGYAGGSLRIEVSDATAADQLALTSDADASVSGAISIAAGVVYLGDGVGKMAIGTVDATENGQNGTALLIHFIANDSGVITNPSFESGTAGWTVVESRVMLGTTVINGQLTPADPTSPPQAGDDAGGVDGMTYDEELSTTEHTDGSTSLRLFNDGQTDDGFDVVHGPYAYSNTFAAQAGDTFHFDWRAAAGQDAFDAFGYLMNADTGEAITVINATGANDSGETDWDTGSVTVPDEGNYFFVFVAGTYDFTGGQAVGGSLYIDNFRIEASPVNDDVIEAIVAKVAYQNTADDPPTDGRTLTVTVVDGVGDQASADGDITVTNVNDVLTGDVTVTGTVEQGAILTASNDIVDPDGNGPVTYQWQRADGAGGWVDIATATNATYELTQADVGKAVRVEATYTDGGGTIETFTSAVTTPVTNVQFAHTGSVSITGTAEQGATLTAASSLADADGLGTIAYQWQRADGAGGWADITNATNATYALTQADVGKAVRVGASYTDGDGALETAVSAATSAAANINDAPTGTVTIAGTVEQGATLTASNTLADADGLGTVAYQWQRADGAGGWIDIDDATGATYDLTQDDVGKTVRIMASYTDDGGRTEFVTATATTAVTNVNDAPTGAVTIAGTVEQGATLTASNTLADADGLGTVAYQWQRADGAGGWIDIDDATGATYDLTQDDVGKAVRVEASYADDHGAAEAVAANATGTVADVQFAHTGTVTIAGTVEQGATLTASNSLADADGLGAIAYQWQREDGAGGWVDIDAATNATYALTQADVGKTVRVEASYTDGDGELETAAATATSAVANINDAPTGGVTVIGRAEQGAILSALNSLADADGLGTIAYQWQRADGAGGWVNIATATGATYQLASADVGKAIRVEASYVDGGGHSESVTSTTTATVTDPPPPSEPPTTETGTVDGVVVQTQTTTHPDGTTTQVITIPIVTDARQEQVGDNAVADIPLDIADGHAVLVAQVPTGLGLQVTGPSEPKPAGESLTDLIREIQAHTNSGSSAQAQMTGGGSSFLQRVAADAPLLVQTIVPAAAAGATAPSEPLVIRGVESTASGPMTALVLDLRGLPSGTEVQLQNIEFAAVIGAAHVTGGGQDSQTVWGDGADQYIVLGGGDDVLHGGSGNDTVGSTGGNDQIFGDSGDDVLFGGTGDDVMNGGEGVDTVLLAGAPAEYHFTHGEAGLRISGADGEDVAINVEALRASNGEIITDLINLVDDTTSVATLTYQFFTGATPSGKGLEYLLHAPDAVNGTDITDAYYQGFNLENRYINFAMNLASDVGEAHGWFETNYGGLDMTAALDKAYAEIFGAAPAPGKNEAILDADVGGGTTRQAYFEALGGPELAVAGLIGWLLAEAAKADEGRYAEANNAFLEDFLDGQAQLNVDLLATYGQPGDNWLS